MAAYLAQDYLLLHMHISQTERPMELTCTHEESIALLKDTFHSRVQGLDGLDLAVSALLVIVIPHVLDTHTTLMLQVRSGCIGRG